MNKYFNKIYVQDVILKFKNKYPQMIVRFDDTLCKKNHWLIEIQYNSNDMFQWLYPITHSGIVTYDTIVEILSVVDKCYTAFTQ